MKTPISAKVSNGSLGGGLASVITWILVTAIPQFHSGIPAIYQPLIPALAGILGYFGTGYKSTHRATFSEVETALKDAEDVVYMFESPEPIAPSALGETELARFRENFQAANGIPTDAQIHDYLQEHPERLVSVARGTTLYPPAPPTAPTDTSEAQDDTQQQ